MLKVGKMPSVFLTLSECQAPPLTSSELLVPHFLALEIFLQRDVVKILFKISRIPEAIPLRIHICSQCFLRWVFLAGLIRNSLVLSIRADTSL